MVDEPEDDISDLWSGYGRARHWVGDVARFFPANVSASKFVVGFMVCVEDLRVFAKHAQANKQQPEGRKQDPFESSLSESFLLLRHAVMTTRTAEALVQSLAFDGPFAEALNSNPQARSLFDKGRADLKESMKVLKDIRDQLVGHYDPDRIQQTLKNFAYSGRGGVTMGTRGGDVGFDIAQITWFLALDPKADPANRDLREARLMEVLRACTKGSVHILRLCDPILWAFDKVTGNFFPRKL